MIELESTIKEEDENENERTSSSIFDPSPRTSSLREIDANKDLFSKDCLYSSSRIEANYRYDYEINYVRFKEENQQECMYFQYDDKEKGTRLIKIDPSENFHDSLNINYDGDPKILNPKNSNIKKKANCFKKLVSKKKRRLQTEDFDLDMCYITERVIGMGFPATGCEKIYRNSLTDTKNFLEKYHEEYKIYNLCIEKNRIYPKYHFCGKKVGLFPFNDHAPCPIRLILDFCIDICLYLSTNPKGVAAIHCKAGKGRTGVMIVCYLLFSGLCESSDEALTHYAKQRTLNNKGVTISSQIRYIKYFESYLCANYEKPYLKCIPKIIKYELNKNYSNMIINYNMDSGYFISLNSFKIKSCLVGPFEHELKLKFNVSALTKKKIEFSDSYMVKSLRKGKWYYEIRFNKDNIIDYDFKLEIKGSGLSFYSWFNLWFSTFESISSYINENNYFEKNTGLNLNENNNNNDNIIKNNENNNDSADKNLINTNSINAENEQDNYLRTSRRETRKTVKASFHAIYNKHRKIEAPKIETKKGILKSIKTKKDLNHIIDEVNEMAKDANVKMIDRDDLVVIIDRKNLDKLKTKLDDNFEIRFNYELLKTENY